MKSKLFFVILSLSFHHSEAAFIYNNVKSVSYFSGRANIIKQIETKFKSGEKVVSLVGMSGMGKTEIARKYAELKFDQYEVIWFLDMAEDLRIQFQQFAREINDKVGKGEREIVSEDLEECIASVFAYGKGKTGGLFILDNLHINENHKALELIKNGINSHIIINSQDKQLLRNIINVESLNNSESSQLIKNINKKINSHNLEVIKKYSHGYPLLLANYSYFKKDHKSQNLELIHEEANIVALENFIRNTLSVLSLEEQQILIKASLLGSNLIDKNLIMQEEADKERVYNLIRLNLLSRKYDNNQKKELLAIHDLVRKTILNITPVDTKKEEITQLINTLIPSPPPANFYQFINLVRSTPNIYFLAENLLNEAERNKAELSKILELKKCLFVLYLLNPYKKKQYEIYNWFKNNKKNFNFKKMNLNEKRNYIIFLNYEALSVYLWETDFLQSQRLFTTAQKLAQQENLEEKLHYIIYANYLEVLTFAGRIKEAQKLSQQILKKYSSYNFYSSSAIEFHLILARLNLEACKYRESLAYTSKWLAKLKNKESRHQYCEYLEAIVETLLRNQEYNRAHAMAEELYSIRKKFFNRNGFPERALIYLANCAINLNRTKEAKAYIKQTYKYYYNNQSYLKRYYNKFSLILLSSTKGEIYLKEKEYTKAYESFLDAERQLRELYDNNIESDFFGVILEKLVYTARKANNHAYAEHYAIQHERIFGKFNDRSRRIDSYTS